MSNASLEISALTALKELMGEHFFLLLDTYLKDSDRRIKDIQTALLAQDNDAMTRAAHSFKGSSSNLGATALSELCFKMEAEGKNTDLTTGEMKQLYDSIVAEYQSVKAELECFRQSN